MTPHWLLITLSWVGSARLQYIHTGGPITDFNNPLDSLLQYPVPYANYFNQPPTSDNHQSDSDFLRRRRTIDDEADGWVPDINTIDDYAPNSALVRNVEVPLTFDMESNQTDVDKRNFSPWGGKRADEPVLGQSWTWKRSKALREPSMPKRVRFSPWGGKRSGQMIYKPGLKGSRIIFSTSIPELTRIVSNYAPNGRGFDLAGLRLIHPSMVDKRHPLKVLALGAQLDGGTMKESLPFRAFLDALPKNFKPGHTYSDVHLKKDGKRKVKFSAWGGKRSPPIIGPIWTPAPQEAQESTLSTILLTIRSDPKLGYYVNNHKLTIT